MSDEAGREVLITWRWGGGFHRARLIRIDGEPWLQLGYNCQEWVDANHSDGVIAAVAELYRLTARPQFNPSAFPDTPQPAWPLAAHAHPPLWTGADEDEAGLLGGPAAGEIHYGGPPSRRCGCQSCRERLPSPNEALLAALSGEPPAEPEKAAGPAPAVAEAWAASEERAANASPESWIAEGRQVLDAYVFTADGHEYTVRRVFGPPSAEFPGEGANITAGPRNFDHVSAACLEILRLAADNAALRDGLSAASMTADEGLEINAELTAALAALLGEPPPEPCSPGCRTPHLSAKASEAVRQALGRWQAMERDVAWLKADLAKAKALARDSGESLEEACVKLAQACAERDGMKAVARHNLEGWTRTRAKAEQLRELGAALKSRGLWRSAAQGEPGSWTAASAIEAIDRLRVRNAVLDDLADDACEIIAHLRAGYAGDAKRWGSDTIQARIRAVVDDASGLEAERLLEAEREKVAAPLRAAIDRLTAERDKMKAWAAEEAAKAMKAQGELDEARASARRNAEGWEAANARLVQARGERDRLAATMNDIRRLAVVSWDGLADPHDSLRRLVFANEGRLGEAHD